MNIVAKSMSWIRHHKVMFVGGCILVAGGIMVARNMVASDTSTSRYVLTRALRGDLVQSVSGSGQVAASTQVAIKSKVSGEIVRLPVAETARIGAGTALAFIDNTMAQRTVRDAEIALETAQLDLLKIKQSSASLDRILEDAFSTTANAFLDFPSVMSSLQEMILGTTLSGSGQDNRGYFTDFISNNDDGAKHDKMVLFVSIAEADYRSARAAYDNAVLLYKAASRFSDEQTLTTLLKETLSVAKKISQSLKSHQNVLDYLVEYAKASSRSYAGGVTTYQTTFKSSTTQVNGHVTALAGAVDDVANAPFAVRSQEIVIKQKETDLADAKDALADYVIRAPFAGEVAELSVQRGDTVSAGATVATMVSDVYVAEISLNEVDIASVAVGQKATLTFDAIPGLKIEGVVRQIDTLGVTSQGVVTYTVLIQCDASQKQVKPGMSVSAAIVVSEKPNVLLIPVSAVKTVGNRSFVEVLPGMTGEISPMAFRQGVTSDVSPTRVEVTLGLSNDSMIEVLGGLVEGDVIISRTMATTGTTVPAQTQQGGFGGIRIPGVTGGNRAR